jgi:EgtB-related family protein
LRNARRAAELAFGPMSFEAGSSDCQCAFDYELPTHRVTIDDFRIDPSPVTNGAFAEFVAAGAYTSSQFLPYPGFTAHLYRDYSRPWFESRQVLRGTSFATHPRMRHPRYRNFCPPERDDIFARFRSCARE